MVYINCSPFSVFSFATMLCVTFRHWDGIVHSIDERTYQIYSGKLSQPAVSSQVVPKLCITQPYHSLGREPFSTIPPEQIGHVLHCCWSFSSFWLSSQSYVCRDGASVERRNHQIYCPLVCRCHSNGFYRLEFLFDLKVIVCATERKQSDNGRISRSLTRPPAAILVSLRTQWYVYRRHQHGGLMTSDNMKSPYSKQFEWYAIV